MDLLTDLLQQAGLRRRLLDLSALTPAAALRFPCGKSIGLHAVTVGRLFVHAPTLDEPVLLQAGDVAVMARGCQHVLSLQARPPAQVLTVGSLSAQAHDPAAGDNARLISGAYQLWNDPLHPFLREMPAWFVLRGASLPPQGPLAVTLGLLDAEARRGDLGASTIVHGLMDAVFTYALRELAQRQAAEQPGWSHAVADPQVRSVLACMHDDCAQPWTLEELARRAGMSRTALAERFRASLGDTPLNHLRTLRMQKAMRLLCETQQNLEQVAQAVGYQDAFGFSKVFKRTTGMAPRAFRQQDAQDRLQPWRLQAQ
jgi:AraC-like DNA-binding protein